MHINDVVRGDIRLAPNRPRMQLQLEFEHRSAVLGVHLIASFVMVSDTVVVTRIRSHNVACQVDERPGPIGLSGKRSGPAEGFGPRRGCGGVESARTPARPPSGTTGHPAGPVPRRGAGKEGSLDWYQASADRGWVA